MSNPITQIKKVLALAFFAGALPFINYASAHAKEDDKSVADWLWEDYRKPVGFTYNAKATLNAAYLWRGLYAGGPNIQASANVGYGGLYADMWWNLGVYDWRFESFQPEVDFSLGFNRWGVDVFLLYVHNFDSHFFDFNNGFGGGNRLEVNVKYTLSNKVPLTIHWATRVSASDGYFDASNQLARAWSSYLEISYVHKFPYAISLSGALGITPWKSCYTEYVHDFGVVNIDIRLRKDWSLCERCGLLLQGQFSMNPTLLAADPQSARWLPFEPAGQTVNANLSVGVYLK